MNRGDNIFAGDIPGTDAILKLSEDAINAIQVTNIKPIDVSYIKDSGARHRCSCRVVRLERGAQGGADGHPDQSHRTQAALPDEHVDQVQRVRQLDQRHCPPFTDASSDP